MALVLLPDANFLPETTRESAHLRTGSARSDIAFQTGRVQRPHYAEHVLAGQHAESQWKAFPQHWKSAAKYAIIGHSKAWAAIREKHLVLPDAL